MPEMTSLIAFAGLALGLALTPGPNMVYLVSRSLCQGRLAGLISLGGVALGFVVYMFCAACGITALLMAGPSLLPQFLSPAQGNVLSQSLVLGFAQILISVSVNSCIAMTAGTIAAFLARRPVWLAVQRWVMGAVLTGLAVRMVTQARR